MKTIYACLSLVTLAVTASPSELNLIPWPAKVELQAGQFGLNAKTVVTADPAFRAEAALLAHELQLKTASTATGSQIHLTTQGAADLGEEAYRLEIDPHGVTIRAPAAAGIFYGGRTLRQLLDQPAQLLPALNIEDTPRFAWRGLMLDVSRHFFDKPTILRLLDWMAAYKLNRFHLHLTDDQAWRLEIGKYPALTQAGARGNFSDSNAPACYFTKSELQEIVRYAAQRHIVVVPEIDMPGHAGAATRTFPRLDGGADTFNPASEATYDFLRDVLRDTLEIFPSPWIHFGGDEVKAKTWQGNSEMAHWMQAEALTDTRQLENYFVRRISKLITDQGRTPAGWDEVAAAGAPPNALIYWWRHDKPEVLVHVLATGHPVVLTPRAPCYFDYPQDKTFPSPWAWKLWNTPEAVYRGPLLPTNLPPAQLKQILGVEGCLWTERVASVPALEFMLLPRMMALAEMAWTPDERRDFAQFSVRLKPQLEQYRRQGIYFYDANKPQPLRQMGEGFLRATNSLQSASTP